jgi:4-amino-4-deoxy-L-arabinose transferase-like glycosyltransferase
MSRRLLGVTILALLLSVLFAALPAAAVEEDGRPAPYDMPGIDELGTQSEIARQFFPEPSDPPPFTSWLVYPLLGLGLLVVLVVLALYLRWHPSFSEEEQARRR